MAAPELQETNTSEQQMHEASASRPGIFYGWWIVAAAFWAMVAHGGTYYSFGVFFKPIEMEFGWARAAISGAITLQMALHTATYVLTGALIDRYGPRRVMPPFAIILFIGYALLSQTTVLWQLYLFYGVLCGIGYGIGYGPLASMVARWFTRRRGLALGIATSGI